MHLQKSLSMTLFFLPFSSSISEDQAGILQSQSKGRNAPDDHGVRSTRTINKPNKCYNVESLTHAHADVYKRFLMSSRYAGIPWEEVSYQTLYNVQAWQDETLCHVESLCTE